MAQILKAQVIIPGEAKGEVLVSDQPISFWGGYDQNSGEIIDRRHPLAGQYANGKVLVLPFSKGSSTATAVLLEAIRLGTAPAAIITNGVDHFFALASIVADELYKKPLPILSIRDQEFRQIRNGQIIEIHRDGSISISNG